MIVDEDTEAVNDILGRPTARPPAPSKFLDVHLLEPSARPRLWNPAIDGHKRSPTHNQEKPPSPSKLFSSHPFSNNRLDTSQRPIVPLIESSGPRLKSLSYAMSSYLRYHWEAPVTRINLSDARMFLSKGDEERSRELDGSSVVKNYIDLSLQQEDLAII